MTRREINQAIDRALSLAEMGMGDLKRARKDRFIHWLDSAHSLLLGAVVAIGDLVREAKRIPEDDERDIGGDRHIRIQRIKMLPGGESEAIVKRDDDPDQLALFGGKP